MPDHISAKPPAHKAAPMPPPVSCLDPTGPRAHASACQAGRRPPQAVIGAWHRVSARTTLPDKRRPRRV